MMSFKHASDATYIAQLLGRMVRTPMQMHITVDEVLNDVHLFLPYFDEDMVKNVVDALQSAEGGDIPTDVYGETLNQRRYDILTVKPGGKRPNNNMPGQLTFDILGGTTEQDRSTTTDSQSQGEAVAEKPVGETGSPTMNMAERPHRDSTVELSGTEATDAVPIAGNDISAPAGESSTEDTSTDGANQTIPVDLFDREEIMKFINDAGLLLEKYYTDIPVLGDI